MHGPVRCPKKGTPLRPPPPPCSFSISKSISACSSAIQPTVILNGGGAAHTVILSVHPPVNLSEVEGSVSTEKPWYCKEIDSSTSLEMTKGSRGMTEKVPRSDRGWSL